MQKKRRDRPRRRLGAHSCPRTCPQNVGRSPKMDDQGDSLAAAPHERTATWPVHKVPRTGSPQTEFHRQDCADPPGGRAASCSPGLLVPPIPPPGPPCSACSRAGTSWATSPETTQAWNPPTATRALFPKEHITEMRQRPHSRPKRNRQTPTQRKARPPRARRPRTEHGEAALGGWTPDAAETGQEGRVSLISHYRVRDRRACRRARGRRGGPRGREGVPRALLFWTVKRRRLHPGPQTQDPCVAHSGLANHAHQRLVLGSSHAPLLRSSGGTPTPPPPRYTRCFGRGGVGRWSESLPDKR